MENKEVKKPVRKPKPKPVNDGLNEDGLMAGKPVSDADYVRVILKHRTSK